MCSTGGERARGEVRGRQHAAGARIARAEPRCFSRDPQKHSESQRGWLGEGGLALRFPAAGACCCCSVSSPLAGAVSVLLHLSVLVPYLLSAASPAPVLPSSSPFPSRTPLLSWSTCLLGEPGYFVPPGLLKHEAHYADRSQGQCLSCTVWLRKVGNLRCIFQALARVANEGFIPEVLLQLLVRGN